MEEEQVERHCCRFCKKAFPCGRSLGGHMRSHMNMSSIETEERRKAPVNGGSFGSSYMDFEAGRRDGYGLRENPKKTWRISDLSNGEFQHAIVCKDCGKEFKSSKALYGHMRSHSDRSHLGLVEDDQKNGGETYKRAFESLSNDDEGDEMKRNKSKRGGHGASPTFSFANAAASVLNIEQEKEDGAICLMMLSRDERPWDEANCFSDDSSDNNSVVLEARSSGMYKRIAEKVDADLLGSDKKKSGSTKNRGEKKLDCKVSDSGNYPIEKKISKLGKSESGFPRDGIQKVESAASDEEVTEEVEFKSKLDDTDNELKDHGAELGDFNWQLGKDSNQKERFYCFDFELASASCKMAWLNGSVTEMGKNSAKLFGSNQVNSELIECRLIKGSESDACNVQRGADLYKKIKCSVWDEELGKNLYKKSRFKCTTCNKTFHSYQALGGHRSSHKKIKGCFATRIESSEQSIQTEIGADPIAEESLKFCRLDKLIDTVKGGKISFGPEKIKGHECPICLKVFTSGQALGGHKRSHLVGNSHNRSKTCQSTAIQQEQSHIFNFLDLNLPAPSHDDENGRGGYNSWLIARNHKREPLVGLISS